MRRFFAATLVGLAIAAMLPIPASANHQCVPLVLMEHVGRGWGFFLRRARGDAMRACASAGGNLHENVCRIASCRP